MSVAGTADLSAINERVSKNASRRLWVTLAVIGGFCLYVLGSFIQFDIAAIAERWSPQRSSILMLDTYAYKDHVTMDWDEPGEFVVALEGSFRNVYETLPEWVNVTDGTAVVSFPNGGEIAVGAQETVLRNWPDTSQDYVFRRDDEGRPFVVGAEADELPEWMRQTANKIEVRPSLYERLQFGSTKVEVHRYQVGWEHFLFDFNSPLRDVGFFGAIGLMFSSDQVVEGTSNTQLVIDEFMTNEHWLHGEVLFALIETLLMALIGTMIACIVGLPLAFLAARNVTPLSAVRFMLRRLFDFLRGIDILVWSLIFLRAFGPGLFTGIFAIAFTDTGTMGKLMSEAIENADNKQREGVASTGASRVQQHRYGIIPQILPVFISQSLYYLESNTRSATIIGAMGAGGIGLQFLGALQTGSDFENVAYLALLVLLLVVFMDTVSARLRRVLIAYDK